VLHVGSVFGRGIQEVLTYFLTLSISTT